MVKEDKSYSASFDDIIWTGTTEYDRPGSKVESLAAIAEGLKVCFMCGAKWKQLRFWDIFGTRLSQEEGWTLPSV